MYKFIINNARNYGYISIYMYELARNMIVDKLVIREMAIYIFTDKCNVMVLVIHFVG